MRHTRVLAPLAVLGLLLPVGIATTPAAAATPTCQGAEATIVGEGTIEGTTGDDVIVALGPASVYADAGDDLICLRDARPGVPTRPGARSLVLDGDGDDRVAVEREAGYGRVQVFLGSGADRVAGGPGTEHVGRESDARLADDLFPGPVSGPDLDPDVIETGAGDDRVQGRHGGDGGVEDTIDLGPGDDEVRVGGDEVPDGGPGRDTLATFVDEIQDPAVTTLVVDAAAEEIRRDDVAVARWSDIETIELAARGSAVDYRGTASADGFTTVGARSVVAHLGAGPDRFMVEPGSGPIRVDGGAGRDTLGATTFGAGSVRASLLTGRMSVAGPRFDVDVASRSMEDLDVAAERVALTGSGQGDRFVVEACHGLVAGRGGPDLVSLVAPRFCQRTPSLVARGEDGSDVLVGTGRPDRLYGGPGRDRADGKGGRDLCQAERTVRCER